MKKKLVFVGYRSTCSLPQRPVVSVLDAWQVNKNNRNDTRPFKVDNKDTNELNDWIGNMYRNSPFELYLDFFIFWKSHIDFSTEMWQVNSVRILKITSFASFLPKGLTKITWKSYEWFWYVETHVHWRYFFEFFLFNFNHW